ncbi:FAD-dependent oxidoreductase, partial [Cutibacterium acnes]
MGTKIVGAIRKHNCIKGIVLANSDGLSVINCRIVVDATGDGDVAAFAGAEYSDGSQREENVQTLNHNGCVRGSFTDLGAIDTRKLSDVMRGLYIAHEMADKYDFRPLLTVRESRRIKGDYEINISDIMFKTCFSDVISVAMTDCDPHGINDSLISRLGYLPFRSG